MNPLVDRNGRIRQPPRLGPQDQYAEGILSLSENDRSLFGFCGEIPMEGGGAAGKDFHSRRGLQPDADTACLDVATPLEDGSLNV
jgi:hypothetical protein